MSAPRVLVSAVVLAQPMGGVRRHNRELLPRLARLLESRGGALALMAGRGGIPFPLPASIPLLSSDVPARPAAARALLEGRALRARLDSARTAGAPFDLVHTGHLPAPRGLPVPYVLTLHDLKALGAAHVPLARRLLGPAVLARGVRRAAVICVVSSSLRSELLAHVDLDPARVHVVPNGCDHLPLLPRAPSAEAALLHVGHLEPRKNVGLLLHALALDPALPPLVLAGAGPEEERLRAMAAELGIAARVRFAGLLDDQALALEYSRCAAVVLPSLREGFGIPALEAQRAGAPLAIARIPALTEVAGADTPAMDPRDPSDCVRAIRSALARSTSALEVAAARARTFTWDAAAEAWCRALEVAAATSV